MLSGHMGPGIRPAGQVQTGLYAWFDRPAWRRLSLMLVLGLVLGGSHCVALAQDGGAAAAALKVLMTPLPGTAEPSPAPPVAPAVEGRLPAMAVATGSNASPGAGSVVVQRGDTLDRLIRRTLGQTPFSAAFLRQAFVRLNPHAFRASGNPHLITAGSTLQVPTAAQLQQLMHELYPSSAAVSASAHGSSSAAHATDAEARKRWVRYP